VGKKHLVGWVSSSPSFFPSFLPHLGWRVACM
jgi:hypothetical protein